MKVICIDSEEKFARALVRAGHTVYSEELGYKSGIIDFKTSPYEVDAMFFNLEKPACFDTLGGDNDGYCCYIEPSPTDELLKPLLPGFVIPKPRPRYQLIRYSQAKIRKTGSAFRYNDVIKAVRLYGCSMFIFMNKVYMKHETGFPPLSEVTFGSRYYLSRTKERKFKMNSTVRKELPLLFKNKGDLSISLPIEYKFIDGWAREWNVEHPEFPRKNSLDSSHGEIYVLYNDANDFFSMIQPLEKGFIFLLPECIRNDKVAKYLLQNLGKLRQICDSTEVTDVLGFKKGKRMIPNHRYLPVVDEQIRKWDVFICHASEDKKDVVRPLAIALQKKHLRVWYDEWTMTIGDSLRRKVEDGLKYSRYGIVVLSPAFFSKQWPQDELDGLFALERNGRKRILPIWHKIEMKEVARFSPILAGRLAAKTADGMKSVVSKLMKAIKK